MKFRIAKHSIRPGIEIVEVFSEDGRFIGQICPGDTDGTIRVISKYLDGSVLDENYPMCVNVVLDLGEERKT